jgi:hypothetical protein
MPSRFIASRNKGSRRDDPEEGEAVMKVALYFAIAILILIGAFLVVQNFEAASGRDVAPHVDMTALSFWS